MCSCWDKSNLIDTDGPGDKRHRLTWSLHSLRASADHKAALGCCYLANGQQIKMKTIQAEQFWCSSLVAFTHKLPLLEESNVRGRTVLMGQLMTLKGWLTHLYTKLIIDPFLLLKRGFLQPFLLFLCLFVSIWIDVVAWTLQPPRSPAGLLFYL